jgi:hypothetical protein
VDCYAIPVRAMIDEAKEDAMRTNTTARIVVYGILATAIGIGAVLLLGGAAAPPTTEGLILQATGHPAAAAAGNRNEAFVILSAYNVAGPIRGIASGSLSVAVVAAPIGSDPVKKVTVTEPVSGVYKIALAPDLASHRWSTGKYVISITFTSPNGTGVVVGDLVIE